MLAFSIALLAFWQEVAPETSSSNIGWIILAIVVLVGGSVLLGAIIVGAFLFVRRRKQ